jgi:polyisoprenoid-binding protein YceI
MSSNNWQFDTSHSSIGFSVRHLMIAKVRGVFHKWTGEVTLDEADVTRSSVNVAIETGSVDTKEEKRDAHLRSADFFNSEKYPSMTFVSTKVAATGDDKLAVTGDLTINGITKSVTLDVETTNAVKDPWGGTRRGFEAKTTINRKDFGLTWNLALEAGGVVVGEKVEIVLDVEAVAAAAQAA